MIKLIMLTGFLGAGKTTLLQNILDEYADRKIGVLINEFGAVSIDTELVAKDGLQMTELDNGSIFCACLKDKFVEALIEMSGQDIEYLFVEASGLADPANMSTILKGIAAQTKVPYDYAHAICVVDGSSFLSLVDVLEALRNQLVFCDVVLLNKTDMIDQIQQAAVTDKILEINPDIHLVPTRFCSTNIREVVDSPSGLRDAEGETSNSFAGRPQALVLKERRPVPYQDLKPFLEEIAGSTYRIKGFLNTGQGAVRVDCVGSSIEVSPWHNTVKDPRIVVISSVGIRIVSIITDAMNKYMEGSLTL